MRSGPFPILHGTLKIRFGVYLYSVNKGGMLANFQIPCLPCKCSEQSQVCSMLAHFQIYMEPLQNKIWTVVVQCSQGGNAHNFSNYYFVVLPKFRTVSGLQYAGLTISIFPMEPCKIRFGLYLYSIYRGEMLAIFLISVFVRSGF